MPANTAKGYPYPLGTDRVMDGDDAIKALASKIPQVQGGAANVAPVANAVASLVVNFPVPFPVGTVPHVVATVSAGNPHLREVSVSAIDNAKFTLNVYATTSTGFPVEWVAMVPGQA